MDDTLDLNGAADLLKVSQETARELAASGALTGAKVGVGWVFLRADLLDYLRAESRRQTSERRAAAEAAKALGMSSSVKPARVKTAASAAGIGQRRRRALPNLDAVDAAA